MAKYIGLASDDPAEDSERKVATSLKKLPDDWIIFHHVSWQSKRNGRQGDGEADFLLLNPKMGLLVLEVKGGGIEIHNGRWSSINRKGERNDIKNPYEQATDSKHALISWLTEHGLNKRLRIGHAVIFPDMTALPNLGPAGVDAISFTKPNLPDIFQSIKNCFNHWQLEANFPQKDVQKLIGLLAPTVSVQPKLSAQSSDAEEEILILTAEQIDAFSGLRAHRGGLIYGGAGTGKTVLAIARSQQLARDGFRTLLVCYNDLLGQDLVSRTSNPPLLTACTFHTLCLNEARRASLFIPPEKSGDWWEISAPNLLIDACAKNTTVFDAIVVDEAQDFSPLWLNALRCLIANDKDAPFFEFADPMQDIWNRNWAEDDQVPFSFALTRNMRNTHQIARSAAAAVDIAFKDRGVSGPRPVWLTTKADPTEGDVLGAVEHLLGEGFDPSSMVVLCDNSRLVANLRERSVAAYSFGSWQSRGITVETISRFKGLEAQAVVLTLSSNGNKNPVQAYVGMSRARSMLTVLGTESLRRLIKWPH